MECFKLVVPAIFLSYPPTFFKKFQFVEFLELTCKKPRHQYMLVLSLVNIGKNLHISKGVFGEWFSWVCGCGCPSCFFMTRCV